MRRVVVTGVGALTPIGLSAPAFWKALLEGVSGADYITKFDASLFRTRFACELKGFDPLQYIDRREARKMDSFTHYAIVAANEAIQDAGLLNGKLDKDAVGVIMASGIGGLYTFMEEMRDYKPGQPPRFNPFFIPKMIIDIAAGHISIQHGFRGPNYATVSACASSANAIADGYLLIKEGLAEVMVVGGSEAAINEAGVGGFNAMRALSERNDDPKTASRPFDKDRDGFVLGEGAGTLVLESLEHALRRGGQDLCGTGGHRLVSGCLSHHSAVCGGRRISHAPRPPKCRHFPYGSRLYQCPWHFHPPRRHQRNPGHQSCLRRMGLPTPHQLH